MNQDIHFSQPLVDSRRVLLKDQKEYSGGSIVYWMNREMRIDDNWAFLYALEKAIEYNVPLYIVYNLVVPFLGGIRRHAEFKKEALVELEVLCTQKGVSFSVLVDTTGDSVVQLADFCREVQAGLVVTDFFPIRIAKNWVRDLRNALPMPLYVVDAHNIVPAWVASQKQEYAAYTIRPKISRFLPEFLVSYPDPHTVDSLILRLQKSDILDKDLKEKYSSTYRTFDTSLLYEDLLYQKKFLGGSLHASHMLQLFLSEKIESYQDKRNDALADAISNLSPYLHYGNISAQKIALLVCEKYDIDIQTLFVKNTNASGTTSALMPRDHAKAFLEELITRRELADNFCLFCAEYDSYEAAPQWARKTLDDAKKDTREYLYTKDQFEIGKTHDLLWNAAQNEMRSTGKMHGYMRMYWAKKILEWSASPEDAMDIAVYLNDKYELDGRDPNGYGGIAWSILGVHDRAWFSHSVYGMVRYMAKSGAEKKFSTKKYIAKWI